MLYYVCKYLNDVKVRLVVGVLDTGSPPGDIRELSGRQNLTYIRLAYEITRTFSDMPLCSANY